MCEFFVLNETFLSIGIEEEKYQSLLDVVSGDHPSSSLYFTYQ